MFDISKMVHRIPDATDASQLTDYQCCPRMWLMSWVLGLRSKAPNTALSFGSHMHEAVDLLQRTGTRVEGGEAALEYLSENGSDLDPMDPKNRTHLRLVEDFIAYEKRYRLEDQQFKMIQSEMSFRVEFPGLPDHWFEGKIDSVWERNDGSIFARDIKTSSYVKKTWADDKFFSNQPFAYQMALGLMFPDRDIWGFQYDLIHIKKGETNFDRFNQRFVPARIDEWMANVRPVLREMEMLKGQLRAHPEAAGLFPMRIGEFTCGRFGGCVMTDVCRAPKASVKQAIVQHEMARTFWSPHTGDEVVPFEEGEFK